LLNQQAKWWIALAAVTSRFNALAMAPLVVALEQHWLVLLYTFHSFYK
jgi:hypothetical protein